MLNTIWQRKHKCLGHVLHHEVLLTDITEERMRDKVTRSRKRLHMLGDFKMTTGYVEVKRTAEDPGLECKEMMEANNLLFYNSRKPEQEKIPYHMLLTSHKVSNLGLF